MTAKSELPVIKIVGVSGSGKSTLVRKLRARGYDARPVSQEHSDVAELWRQFEPVALLIYLSADLESQRRRRPDVSWTPASRRIELARLRNAHANADLRIDTSQMTPSQVLFVALSYLDLHSIRSHGEPLPPRPATGSAFSDHSD